MRGKESNRTDKPERRRDHPRLCGEKGAIRSTAKAVPGSPPPMRGKVHTGDPDRNLHRITPAYAGKSGHFHHRQSRRKDHPRLCGEKKYKETKEQWQAGSPPPMRGKVLLQISNRLPLQDHPRLCGEKLHPAGSSISGRGSPPPMRGKD